MLEAAFAQSAAEGNASGVSMTPQGNPFAAIISSQVSSFGTFYFGLNIGIEQNNCLALLCRLQQRS
jgi:hypothetical protein